MTSMTRRTLLATGAAGLALRPLAAQENTRFAAALDRAQELDQLRCLVIAQGGQVIRAEALRGPGPDRPVNVKSVSKTIVSSVLGAAVDREIVEVDTTLGEVMPRLIPSAADPGVPDITLADLVTLRGGLERTSGSGYGPWVASGNWVSYALSRPMVAEPGAQFLYSTGSTHLLGVALAEAADRSLLALARDWIGQPLGIEIPAWTRDPQGYYLGGNEMAVAPLDLVRFGEMYRQGGMLDGTRVLSAEWVEASWTPRTRSPFSRHNYGYGWFLAETGGFRVNYARGYGGQMVYVVPELELTVVITSDPTRPARSAGYGGTLNRLLAELIVPEVA